MELSFLSLLKMPYTTQMHIKDSCRRLWWFTLQQQLTVKSLTIFIKLPHILDVCRSYRYASVNSFLLSLLFLPKLTTYQVESTLHTAQVSVFGVILVCIFPAFPRILTECREIRSISLRIQSKCRKMQEKCRP